jgi:hypothetical protein
VRESSQTAYSEAQKDYANALAKSTQAPPPAYTDQEMETPSWARSTIPEGMPGYNTAKNTEQEEAYTGPTIYKGYRTKNRT